MSSLLLNAVLATALQDRVHLTVDDVPTALDVARRWADDVQVVDGDWLVLRVPDGAAVLPDLLLALGRAGVDVRTAEAERAVRQPRRTGW